MGFSWFFIFALVANCFSSPVRSGDEKGDSILPHRLFIEDEDFLDDEDGLRESPDLSTLEEISETEDIPDENNRNRDQDSLPEDDTPTIEVLHNLLNVRNGEKTQEDAKPVTTEKEDLNLARESVVRIPIGEFVEAKGMGKASQLHTNAKKVEDSFGGAGHIETNQPVEKENGASLG